MNYLNKQDFIEKIFCMIEKEGLMPTIKNVFGKGTIMALPFTKSACETSIEELNLSVRSTNALKGNGLTTVEKVVLPIQQDKLSNIRNIGAISQGEIRVKIYEFGYSCLSPKSRREFVKNLIETNCDL